MVRINRFNSSIPTPETPDSSATKESPSFTQKIDYGLRNLTNNGFFYKDKVTFTAPDGTEYKIRENRFNHNISVAPRNSTAKFSEWSKSLSTAKFLEKRLTRDGKTDTPQTINENTLKIDRPDGTSTLFHAGKSETITTQTYPNTNIAEIDSNVPGLLPELVGAFGVKSDATGTRYRILKNGDVYVNNDPAQLGNFESLSLPEGYSLPKLRANSLTIGAVVNEHPNGIKHGVYALSEDGRCIVGLSPEIRGQEIVLPASIEGQLEKIAIRSVNGRLHVDALHSVNKDTLLQFQVGADQRIHHRYISLGNVANNHYIDLAVHPENQRLLLLNQNGQIKHLMRGGNLEEDPSVKLNADEQIKNFNVVYSNGQPKLFVETIGSDFTKKNTPLEHTKASVDKRFLYELKNEEFVRVPIKVDSTLLTQTHQGLPQPNIDLPNHDFFETNSAQGKVRVYQQGDVWQEGIGNAAWLQTHSQGNPLPPARFEPKKYRLNADGAQLAIDREGLLWVKKSEHEPHWQMTGLSGYDDILFDNANYANQFGVVYGKREGELYQIELKKLFTHDRTAIDDQHGAQGVGNVIAT